MQPSSVDNPTPTGTSSLARGVTLVAALVMAVLVGVVVGLDVAREAERRAPRRAAEAAALARDLAAAITAPEATRSLLLDLLEERRADGAFTWARIDSGREAARVSAGPVEGEAELVVPLRDPAGGAELGTLALAGPAPGPGELAREHGTLLAACLALAVLLVVCVSTLEKILVRRPLARLAAAAARLARGELDAPLPEGLEGELAVAAGALDRLRERLREARGDLERMEVELRELHHTGDRFLANMSHEIRTPLTAIIGFAEMVDDPDADEKQRRAASQTVRRNAQHLLAIVDDVLDLAKIRAEKMTVESIDADPLAVLEEVLEMMEPRAAAKGLDLELAAAEDVPRSIRTDPTRLRQILVNLAGNAIKFSRTGAVTLGLRRVDAELEFTVEDRGIGMSAEELERVFEPFTQADTSVTRIHGGTGLGLAISRQLAELLGGSLRARSTPGRGSVFALRVPIRETAPEGAAAGEAAPPRTAAAPGERVLVVEDNPDNRFLFQMMLRRLGAEVTTATDGEQAISAWHEAESTGRAFSAIVMDMQMPVLDGFATTRRLREAGCRTPIIALTAHLAEGDARRCEDAGCDAFATKPITAERLQELLARTR